MRARRRAIAAMALLIASFAAAASARAFEVFTNCQLVGDRSMLVDVTAVETSRGAAPDGLDLIVNEVIIEARSTSGQFWVQLWQPVTANLEFDVCRALGERQIPSHDLDAIRVLVIGQVFDGQETVGIRSRCGLFPPPSCQAPD